jgi:hypothetical protein
MPRATTAKTQKVVKAAKATKASAKPAKTATAASKSTKGPKKGTKKAAVPKFLPLKGTKYVFVGFKDASLEEKIVRFGGTVSKAVKTADVLVCEDIWGEKSMDVICKFNKHDNARSKEDIENEIEEFEGMEGKAYPELVIGKTTIQVRCEWFPAKGVAVDTRSLPDAPEGAMVYEDEAKTVPYDICFHQDGNAKDMYTQLYRLQLLHDETAGKYIVINASAFLVNICNGSDSRMSSSSIHDTLDGAVEAFTVAFKEHVGFTWRNRATCKPKKGSALLVNFV